MSKIPPDNLASSESFLVRLTLAKSLTSCAGTSEARLADADELIRRIHSDLQDLPIFEKTKNQSLLKKLDLLIIQYPQNNPHRRRKSLKYLNRIISKIDDQPLRSKFLSKLQERPWHALQVILILFVLVTVSAWATMIFYFPNINVRAANLIMIEHALEKYRNDHGGYPITGSVNGRLVFYGIGWNSDDPNWIPGLVPNYLDRLPVDPRKATIKNAQYIYASNGSAYKIVSMLPEDCWFAVLLRPWLRDPVRSPSHKGICQAYGIYSPGAEKF